MTLMVSSSGVFKCHLARIYTKISFEGKKTHIASVYEYN